MARRRQAVTIKHVHDAIDIMADEGTPVIAATDGTVEAVEGTTSAFLFGVQWHAECLVKRRAQLALPGHEIAAGRGQHLRADRFERIQKARLAAARGARHEYEPFAQVA